MAIRTAEYLKSRFEKGDLPSQEDFEDLIDSSVNNSLSGEFATLTLTNTLTSQLVLNTEFFFI
jgi:hypothetical protein